MSVRQRRRGAVIAALVAGLWIGTVNPAYAVDSHGNQTGTAANGGTVVNQMGSTNSVVINSGDPQQVKCAEAVDVVAALYRQLVERDADPGGLNTYAKELNVGNRSVRDLVKIFVTGDEYKARFYLGKTAEEAVRGLYHHIDAREADDDGLKAHAAELRSGMSFEKLVEIFVTADEYLAYFRTDTVPYSRARKEQGLRFCQNPTK